MTFTLLIFCILTNVTWTICSHLTIQMSLELQLQLICSLCQCKPNDYTHEMTSFQMNKFYT